MSSDDVVMYVVPGCPLCEDARNIMRKAGIRFSERDVANDFGALRRMYRGTKQALVPVIEKDGRFYVRPSDDELRTIGKRHAK